MSNVVLAAMSAFTFSFATYTLLTHYTVATHGTFEDLVRSLAPASLAGLALAVALLVFFARSATANPDADRDSPDDGVANRTWIAAAALLVLGYWVTGRFSLFWITSVAYGILAVRRTYTASATAVCNESPIDRRAYIAIIGTCVIAAVITLCAHRPDNDDGFFLSIAARALSHPTEPLLSTDTMGHSADQALPLLLAVYKVHSIELIPAILARLLGGHPLYYAHIVLPAVLAVVMMLAWTLFFQEIAPKHLGFAVVVTLVFAVILGEHHRGFANFAFVRLHQGKAAMVSIAVPLGYAFVWRYLRLGRVADLAMLVATVVAGIGMSSTALFVMPVVVASATISAWTPQLTRRCLAISISVIYPVFLALLLREQTLTSTEMWNGVHERTSDILASTLGHSTQYFVMFAMLSAWAVADKRVYAGKLARLMLFALAVPLNPLLADVVARHVTSPPTYWRVLWTLPIYGFCTVLVVAGMARLFSAKALRIEKWRVGAALSMLGLFGVWLLPHNSLRSGNSVSLRWPPELKVSHPEYEISRLALSVAAGNKSILAPEGVAVWLAAEPHHPPLVIVREAYVQSMRRYLTDQDWTDRARLVRVLSGQSPVVASDGDVLARTTHANSVGVVVLHEGALAALKPRLDLLGFRQRFQDDRYAVFTR